MSTRLMKRLEFVVSRGVLDGLREYGITDPIIAKSDYSFIGGQKNTREILEKADVDAIICATDRLAFGCYKILQRKGFRRMFL